MTTRLKYSDITYISDLHYQHIPRKGKSIECDTQLFFYDTEQKVLEIYNRFFDPKTFEDGYELVGILEISLTSFEALAKRFVSASEQLIKEERIYDLRNQVKDLEEQIRIISSSPKSP